MESLKLRKIAVDRAHRLGRYKSGSQMAIIDAFRDYTDIDVILTKAGKLKGTEFSINRDYLSS